MVAHNPLHGSGQAALPHPALALGEDGQPLEWIGVADAGEWKPSLRVLHEAIPRHAAFLTAAPEHPSPGSSHCFAESAERRAVKGHAVVAVVPEHDRAQVGA